MESCIYIYRIMYINLYKQVFTCIEAYVLLPSDSPQKSYT